MKPTMALKPLVFALAAVMAMAAQAGGGNEGGEHGHGHQPKGPTLEQLLQIGAGASATVLDAQKSDTNVVTNQGTNNNAKIDASLNGSNGNMGANSAAGDGNQQDNAAAIASSDESFIFGTSTALSSATQVNNNNYVSNSSTQNNATLNNSGNNGSGNIGMNVSAGDFNQQKNNLAIASSGGRVAQAAAAANQSSTNLVVDNKGVQTYKTSTLTGTVHAAGEFVAIGEATTEGGRGGRGDEHHGKDTSSDFIAVGVFGLSGVTTQQVLTPDGWKNPVVNNASMTNSMNNFSGNGGANVSAGSGNQQSNSLAISSVSKM
ncbi:MULTISPECIES: heme utilization protein [unclassified Pseudomonas]|uniref:heme utilization protein n=1 Tax=unclassified Pseudomonas TaxID=196821 RepID=UPI002AC979E5|nr:MULTISPECIES: heme utilization protein [unclassified Pseudomonas]MEB0046758.1 heme utilization protein [Pseudomonas sp. Dout3]MEB0097634.1 heme utilization protein [Pseudomonas sp. DC1.2]WPX61281.1 heme utilization protein [Pseudomonas sp. DC1.2]